MVEVSYCIVNTEQRELLAARPRRRRARARGRAVRDRGARARQRLAATARPRRRARTRRSPRSLALPERRGKGENDSALLQRARGRFCLLLNEDSELLPGATAALRDALDAPPARRRRGRRAAAPRRHAAAVGVALPGAGHGARAGAVPAPPARRPERRRGRARGRLGAVGRAARAPRGGRGRRLAGPELLRLLRRGRLLPPAARRRLERPARARRRARSTTSSSRPTRVPERRIVELARNRDRYMRKHHSTAAALRACAGSPPGPTPCAPRRRSCCPGHSARRYWRHVTATLAPGRGEGLAEAAAAFNRGLRDGGTTQTGVPGPGAAD